MKTAWSVPIRLAGRSNGLTKDAMYDWAIRQANMSDEYRRSRNLAVSKDAKSLQRKENMLDRVRDALVERSNLSGDDIERRMKEVSDHLEDPGLLLNFEYFDVPSSDFMLQFYFAVWDRRIAEAMEYLHDYGKDLMGIAGEGPQGDVWRHMSSYEGMNINERKKAADVIHFIRDHKCVNITSFGGGNVPERLFGLMRSVQCLTVFDDGPTSPLRELFTGPAERVRVNYIRESLFCAPTHGELLSSQDLVWMHGVSMYLDESKKQMTSAILAGLRLLDNGGYMKYDYLVENESMRRVISTQCWPYDPVHPMFIQQHPGAAIHQGLETLDSVRAALPGYIRICIQDPVVTVVEPWGATSVRFTIQKVLK